MTRAPRSRIGSLVVALVVLLVVVSAAIVVATRVRDVDDVLPPPFVPSGSAAGSPFGAAASGGKPVFGHAYVIVLENHSYDLALGGDAMPYLKQLAKDGAVATKYAALTHPSQPNYIGLWAGDTFGVDDDGIHDIDAETVAGQLERHGLSWSVSAENYPGGCFKGATAKGGDDGDGTYVRKHNPAMSFTSISGDPARCRRIHDLSTFDPAEAELQLIVPNLCNDGHDCPLSTADRWLREFVPQITDSDAFRKDGVLFVTFDEAEKNVPNVVPLVALGPSVRAGTTSDHPYTHYSLLRTIEDNWSLGCLARACAATPLTGIFTAPLP